MSEKGQIPPKLLSQRRVWIVALFCVLLTAFLFWNESHDKEFSFSELNWTSSSILFLLLALLMMVFRDLAYMFRIRLLTEKKLNWRQSFNVILIWEFASALSPGVVGGSAVAMFILQKEKIPLGKSTALVLVTAIMDNLFYIISIPLILLFINFSAVFPADLEWLTESGLRLFWVGYSILLFANLLLFIGVFISPRIISSLVQFIFRLPFLKKYKTKADSFGEDLAISSKELRGKPFLFWIKLFLLTVWSWTSRFLVINFLLMAFLEIGLFDHLILLARQLLMWLGMLVTPSPGGSGMAEYLFTQFFSDFIKNSGAIFTIAFLWRLISYYLYLIIGSIILPSWSRKK